jgi:hypothetical protein
MSYSRGPVDGPMFPSPSWSDGPVRSAWPDMMAPPESAAPRGISETGVGGSGIGGYPLLMGGFFVAFLIYLLYLGTRSDVGMNGNLRSISDLFVVFGSAVCAVMCWYTAAKLRQMQTRAGMLVGRAWLAWTCLGCAAFTYSVGQGIWTWFDGHYASAQLPFPAAYDPFYLLVYPFSWVGIALLIPRGGTAAGRTRLLLDAGIAVASALAITWYFILGPTVASLNGPPIEKTVALAYPLGDLSLCVAAALLLFGPSGATALNGPLGRLAIGVTWLALTDSLYGYLQLQGTYHTGLVQDIGWPMSWLFVGWAALVYPAAVTRLAGQSLTQESSVGRTRLGATGAALRAITPIMLALGTCAVLLLVVALRNVAPFTQVVLVCAGLILLPVVRQLLTLIDNLILNDRLRLALGQSQQAYQQSQQALVATSSRAERYDELRAGIADLQAVHARLARGDLNARARVEGPLTPVAQSLNLLVERLKRWAQFAQMNQVMEAEADQLRRVLEALSEGQLPPFPDHLIEGHSTYTTGGALVAASHLQHYLGLHAERLRTTLGQFGKSWSSTLRTLQELRSALQQESSPQQQAQLLQDALAEVERHIAGSQIQLQALWRETQVYVQAMDQAGLPYPPGGRS